MPRIACIAVWSVAAILAAGCERRPSEAGELGSGFDEERKARRIPIVPEHWKGRIATRSGRHEAHWRNPAFADPELSKKPMHARKYVVVDEVRNAHEEHDDYFSGRKYPSRSEPDSTDWERLTIRYDFEAERLGKNPWRCEISCGPHHRNMPRNSPGK